MNAEIKNIQICNLSFSDAWQTVKSQILELGDDQELLITDLPNAFQPDIQLFIDINKSNEPIRAGRLFAPVTPAPVPERATRIQAQAWLKKLYRHGTYYPIGFKAELITYPNGYIGPLKRSLP